MELTTQKVLSQQINFLLLNNGEDSAGVEIGLHNN